MSSVTDKKQTLINLQSLFMFYANSVMRKLTPRDQHPLPTLVAS